MLFRKHIVSTRTLFQLAVAVVLSVVGVGTAAAANSGNPPLLVPSISVTAAGDNQFHGATATAPTVGYKGDGGAAASFIYCSTTITTNCVYSQDASKQGQIVTGAEMSAPHMVAVDSVGNLYITDTNNHLIREVNAQTGFINTVAGALPVGGKAQTGCADGAPAYGSALGAGLSGIAVDGYGNVYFTDSVQQTVGVVYRGGAQLAALINLVNPGAVAVAGGVLPGYIYHIAGTINVGSPTNTGASCAAIATYNGLVSDNGPAFENSASPPAIQGATLNGPTLISLDSAGNIYISDVRDATVRVINTQATPQTFYQYTVQPGYMRSITECNGSLTILCPNISTTTQGTGINGPVNEVPSTNQWVGSYTDAYGNTFQFNGTGSGTTPPGIFVGVAYAGGAPVTNLLNAEAPFLTTAYGPNGAVTGQNAAPPELPLVYGDWYVAADNPAAATVTLLANVPVAYGINNIDVSIRATDISEDGFGTFWWNDGHYPELMRMDQFSSTVTQITGGDTANGSGHTRATTSVAGVYPTYASFTNPWYCVYGSSGAANNYGPATATNPPYPISFSPTGDGCPAIVSYFNTMKYGQVSDGQGNLFMMDSGWGLLKEIRVGTDFPATPLASSPRPNPTTQAIQVHFDAGNPPAGVSVTTIPDGAAVGYTTTAFSITPSTDFAINTTQPEWPIGSLIKATDMNAENNTPTANSGNFQLWPNPAHNPPDSGLPACTQLGISLVPADTGYDCVVYVTFNPNAPGLRQAELVASTANGGTYTFPLNGLGTSGQLAIDGGQATKLAVNSSTALGPAAQVAVNSSGTVYIADPTNNRVVVQPTAGFASTTGQSATTIGSGLSGPMGVAVDAAGNVYISDTGNNRVVKVTPGGTQSTLGNNVWISGATCYPATGSPAGDCTLPTNVPSVAALGPDPTPGAITGTTPPPQYQFKSPQGLAVDQSGNVYVADTGNAAVVEIPSNINLGGAIPLLVGTGVQGFVNPVSVAVDSQGYIYVADTGNPAGDIVRIPPGGGDLQPGNVVGFGSLLALPLFGGQGITTPNGVAADAAGNVYVSDSSTGLVWVAPAVGPPNGTPYTLNLSSLGTPAGLALDPSGNLYVADAGNNQVLALNRLNPTVSFGTVPEDLASPSGVAGTPVGCPVAGGSQPCSGVLTVTNVGNAPLTLLPTATFLSVSGSGNTGFNPNVANPAGVQNCTTLYTSLVLPAGSSCTISPTFQPTSNSAASEIMMVNGAQSVALTANGGNPEVAITLTSNVGLTPAAGQTATITATVSQPHTATGTPTGTVTFTYSIDAGTANAYVSAANPGCGAPGTSAPITLVGGVATYSLPTLAQGLVYTVNATYNPGSGAGADTNDGLTAATPIVLSVPGISFTSVTANSVSYIYGQAVPTISGTTNPALPSGVTATFTSGGASQFSNVGVYPIQVVFAGTNFCGYGFPAVTQPGGGAATVTENKAPLTVTVPDYTTVYGAATFNYNSGLVITGAVGSDLKKLSATYTNGPPPAPPAIPVAMDSSVLDVGKYQVYPTVTGKPVGNYTITLKTSTVTNLPGGSDTVTPAPPIVSVTPAAGVCNSNFSTTATCELPQNVHSGSFTLNVATQVAAGKGTPSGEVNVTDNFIAITPTFFDTSTNLQPAAPPSGMPACSSTVTTNCYAPICTAAMAGCYTYSPPCSSTVTTNCNLLCSATVTANCFAQPCSSTVTSYCYTTYPPCSTSVTGSNCIAPVPLTAGTGTFSLPTPATKPGPFPANDNTPGIHYLSFAYTGDLPLCTSTSGSNCIPPVCSTSQTTNCLPAPCAAGATTNCTPNGPASITTDAKGDFSCTVVGGTAQGSCPTTGANAFPLVVDFADFNLTSTFTLIDVNPGVVPSGNGLPSAPGQSSAAPETGTLQIQQLLSFTGGGSNGGAGVGPMNVSCTTDHPSYVSCFMTPTTTCLTSTSGNCLPAQTGTVGTTTVVLAVSTPVSLPLGFKTSEVRTAATRTVLAFLPFGVLAFCVRRRRRLSQVLWMLIAICAVSAGMIGCGSNNSSLYTPIPTGLQNVVVNVTGTTPLAFTGTVTSGSATVTAVSVTLDLAVGETVSGTGIPADTTIASVTPATSSTTASLTLSTAATGSATATTITATLPVSRSYTIPINIF